MELQECKTQYHPMKRSELIKYLKQEGTRFIREGRRHSIYARGEYRTEIPRHSEIVDDLARKICKDLNIPFLK